MLDKKTLFHDMTMTYMRPVEPVAGMRTTFRLRAGAGQAVRAAMVWNGERVMMERDRTEGAFDFFACRIRMPDAEMRYYFEVDDGEERFVYDLYGVRDMADDALMFRLYPGFRMPEWMKGAVIYQIFTDRFFNGDPSNDVLNGEYHYISGHARQVKDWESLPDADNNVREFYGGDLAGVLQKMDYLQELGIEVLYFNPLFCSPSSHKYDTQDYDHIDPHFGRIVEDGGALLSKDASDNSAATRYMHRVTSERNLEASDRLFQEVVTEAHRRGMKVIIDGVFNHCGSFNKWLDRERLYEKAKGYVPGAYVSADSPYRDFFDFREEAWPYNGSYDGWWGFETLPKLHYEASEALQEYILQIAGKWVSAPFNADGWRLDVAADLGHSRTFNHAFWKRFRQAVKTANPEAVILAEHYGDAYEWLKGDEWDTVMNYDSFMEPVSFFLTGMEKHSDMFAPEKVGDADLFFEKMIHLARRNFCYNSMITAMNELSNHDHSRFLTRTNQKVGRAKDLGGAAAEEDVRPEIMREAVVIQMTWPGAPTVYYGDEAGLTGFTDPDNRRTYPWGKEDLQMLSFHKEIIRIHKENMELKTGSVFPLAAADGVIAFGRFNRFNACVTIVNNNTYSVTKELEVCYLGVPAQAQMQQLLITSLSGFRTNIVPHAVTGGKLTLTVPPFGAMILRYSGRKPLSSEQFWASNKVDFSDEV